MLSLKNISHRFGKKQVLNDISFDVEPGQITCIIGVNGVGKTTLMNLIMKLLPLQAGSIQLDHEDIELSDFNRLAYIPDQIIVLKSMTIQEALDYMERYYTTFNPVRASELLEFFRLDRHTKVGSLSKGNVAKVNLLLGLSLDTDYLIMDEPFSGIDALAREQIVQVFHSKLIENRGVLISTHEINDIEHLIDKAVILSEGQIIKEFNPDLIREQEGKSIIDIMREVS